MSRTNAEVLLIGAYERDNFGDLLFFQLTKEYLAGHQVVAGSIIGADMTALLGTTVHAHNPLLAQRAWDAVWVVGGEVGGVTTENALAMSLGSDEGDIFDSVSAHGREVVSEYLADASALAPAYLPELKRFPLNLDTPLVINSVGLGTMSPVGSSPGANAAISALRSSRSLSVRDPSSLRFALASGLNATLSPDMVHAIPILYPELAEGIGRHEAPYFLFQSNAHLVEKYGAEAIAKSLAGIALATGWRPVLFLAGIARHHDRADQYDEVISMLTAIAPNLNPTVIATRAPLELAAWIAGSEMWIGSSLHGRIIAGSFLKPRVSLVNLKVATYASHWDSEFPAEVEVGDLGDAASVAISAAQAPAAISQSRELSRAADRATRQLVEENV
ncbi:polysaccharide pyruvyl transferase family protein [Cryobacterium psychrophilum]|uniref:polysaccharide pyruvyl transferase family protein n=1 Tax=Cryobacterium psychrophilum TaxID=41988 RepID=UPI0010D7CED6|nr:polysaccharide pyruvyl transferase family protein [Cryobacterium psychrophilum]TDW30684.1 polysaccharide pyruvyl transferase WcaK-like protein [Cryobacterium psychrophilum]